MRLPLIDGLGSTLRGCAQF